MGDGGDSTGQARKVPPRGRRPEAARSASAPRRADPLGTGGPARPVAWSRRPRYALRARGIVMQRGPPRPRESSFPESRTAIRAAGSGAESP